MSRDEELQSSVLFQLFRKEKWMGNHIAYDKIKKWVIAFDEMEFLELWNKRKNIAGYLQKI